MLKMVEAIAEVDGASSRAFQVTKVGVVTIAVCGLTAGEITIEFCPTADPVNDDWYDLDATNLVFTADGNKYVIWGACWIRATGNASVASSGNNFFLGIGGSYVHDPNADH